MMSCVYHFCFKQKTAYDMRISDWSSDVCSSDLRVQRVFRLVLLFRLQHHWHGDVVGIGMDDLAQPRGVEVLLLPFAKMQGDAGAARRGVLVFSDGEGAPAVGGPLPALRVAGRSEEHTSELQSLMRISYAVFCLKKKTTI